MDNTNVCAGGAEYEALELYEADVLPLENFLWKKVGVLESQNVNRSFFLLDLGELYRKLEEWRRFLPRVQPFYAVKCNPLPIVSRFLADAGVGFDCAGKTEIQQILDLGVHPSRIVYSNPFKQTSYLTYAADSNVDLMTFDNVYELVKIKKYFPNARLILRIRTRNEPGLLHNLNNKYGCHVKHAGTLLTQALEMKLNVVGVSFHVGGPLKAAEYYSSAIERAYRVFNIARSLGINMDILDLGGAFPGMHNGYVTFTEVAEVVNKSLDQYFPASDGVRVIAEPGRYFVTTAFTLAVNIIAKNVVCDLDIEDEEPNSTLNSEASALPSNRLDESNHEEQKRDGSKGHIRDETSGDKTKDESLLYMYVLNQGTCGAFANVAYDKAEVQLKVLQKRKETTLGYSEPKSSKFWGPSCAPFDCVIPECKLSEMEVGQWLYVPNMGAYGLSLASNFNGIELPLVFSVCSQDCWKKIYPGKQPTQDHQKSKL